VDTQNLKAFTLVAETGSFSVAAEKLHLTQPAISKRIALLEQQLDAELFDRIGRNISLTEAGHALLPHARTISGQLLAAEQAVRDLSGDITGSLRLATSHHIGLHRLPPVLNTFSRSCSGVKIDIDFMDSEQAYELVMQGKIELAVVTLAPAGETSIIAKAIWRDPLDFMAAKNHALAKRENYELEYLSHCPAILPGLNTYTGQIVKRLFDRRELQLQVSMATNYLETIRMMASVGLGWTVLPRSMKDKSLKSIAVPEVHIERTLGLVYHKGRSLSRAANAFAETLSTFADVEVV